MIYVLLHTLKLIDPDVAFVVLCVSTCLFYVGILLIMFINRRSK